MNEYIDLRQFKTKDIYPLSQKFAGKRPDSQEISFTNYYMEVDSKPVFAISGEFHYSRCCRTRWEDEIIKMKMCGINVVSTYIFWIHHEEEEGIFRFDDRRDIRTFVQLCHKHGLYVIVRIGPFDHGEVRNGGLPDWLYGKPFEVRSLNDGFLFHTKRLYDRLGEELKELYYKDGGPIIAAQIDNEYEHSSAPWELTTGASNEWVFGGNEGNDYMLCLKELAKQAGIDVPFYTCTGWGGAATPSEEMMPLWGGYAFWPWIFYNKKGEHPATPEYIYRDNHNNNVPTTYNFEPNYLPESRPYACCEMGGGMTCYYNYRFLLPYESVDAMANIKIASGCNFLGYYMFKGGSNPKGVKTEFLNECQVPKISYDYQAPIGEFGEIRPSYKRLKRLHYFVNSFGDQLCGMKTILPKGSQEIEPEDTRKLRYAVRTDGIQGFVFINNYQDHVVMEDKSDAGITLKLTKDVTIKGINLVKGENCILPFNLNLDGIKLVWTLAQPITRLESHGQIYYFFFVPDGMEPVYFFQGDISIDNIRQTTDTTTVKQKINVLSSFQVSNLDSSITIVTLTKEQSLNFYKTRMNERECIVITPGGLLVSENEIRVEHSEASINLLTFPPNLFMEYHNLERIGSQDLFGSYKLHTCEKTYGELKPVKKGFGRYTIEIPKDYLLGVKESILSIDYVGDIGHAFIDGDLIADNFCNGTSFDIGLSQFASRLKDRPLTIYITPMKQGTHINVDSVMAGRMEQTDTLIAEIGSVCIKPVYELPVFKAL